MENAFFWPTTILFPERNIKIYLSFPAIAAVARDKFYKFHGNANDLFIGCE